MAAILLCAGCSTSFVSEPENLVLTPGNTGSFGPRPEIPTPEEIHRLAPGQLEDFLGYMADPVNANTRADYRLYYYIEKVVRDFSYEGITYDASHTLALNSGNCMSLAILTTALAEAAGLDFDYQLMDDVPVYEFNGTTVKKGLHIRTMIFDPDVLEVDEAFMFIKPGITIDYFPTNRNRFVGNLDRSHYLAMLYENLAAEALDRNDPGLAYWLVMEALQYVPDHAPAINTLAVVNRRTGDPDTAEFIYRYGIAHADDKLMLLRNYHTLLKLTGRTREAAIIQQQLDNMEDDSPFHWFLLARNAYDEGDYGDAIRYYNKALVLAPYLHEAWLGIAQANYEMGRLSRTRSALEAAFNEAAKVSTRNLYQAKLAALSRETAY